MRVVAALGGNALLRRGEPLTAENQRANARVACKALAPIALEHELVISQGTVRRSASSPCRAPRTPRSRRIRSICSARRRKA